MTQRQTFQSEDEELIKHLIEVEQNAFLQTKEAQDSVNQSIRQATLDSDARFESEYTKAMSEIDSKAEEQKKQLRADFDSQLADYKALQAGRSQYKDAFNAFLDRELYG